MEKDQQDSDKQQWDIGQINNQQLSSKEVQLRFLGNCRSVSEFQKLHQLGEGTYGTVFCAKDKLTGELYALKKVKIHDINEGFPITSLREIKILRELPSHLNIVRLHEVVVGYKSDSIFLVFEYCNIDLADLVDLMSVDKYYFSESEIKCIILQLLNAVRFLHQNYIMHRDLKLSNLLLNKKGIIKLADFGLSRKYEKPAALYTGRVVTLWYRAPELLVDMEEYSQKIDIWQNFRYSIEIYQKLRSIGCIFGELLNNGIPILRGTDELNQFKLICELIGFPSKKIWPLFQNCKLYFDLEKFKAYEFNTLPNYFKKRGDNCLRLLNSMLTWDPKKRISADEAIVHPYFFEHPRPCEPNDIKILSKLDYFDKKKQKYTIKKQKLDK